MKAWLLKLHRWIALLFALPLVVVLVTGLVLSLEPWLAVRAIEPGSLTAEKIQALLAQHDPEGRARSIAYRSYDNTLTVSAGRGSGATVVDLATGQTRDGPSALADLLTTARRLHEHLLIDAEWIVVGSTLAMLALALLGVLMGLPRIANTFAGWHKAMAWGLLPLVVLSPLSGLLLAWNVTFAGPSPANTGEQRARLPLAEAVRIVGERHDLSTLVWLRPQGGRVLARLVDGNEYRVYAVTREGTTAVPRNWPRLWHEGNFAGAWSAAMNFVLSLALIGLLGTGFWIWLRRKIRRLRSHRPQMA
ncbi:MAG: PepSY domain-containing protein [Gammaproteobacteria bacterium]|nr:PepSY domain-containing protein [Gammaproteobacteria bacterium]